MKETYWKYSLIILIIGLGILLFRQAQPFMNGILGGFTLYLLLRNPTHWLQQKMNGSLAVWLVTLGTTLFILIPLSLFSWAVIRQLSGLHFDTQSIIEPTKQVIAIIKERTGYDLFSEQTLSFVVAQASSIGQSVMSGVSDFVINLCVAIMLLFFMLSGGRAMEHYISTVLPFREENKREVLDKVQLIVRSNAIGIPLLAIIPELRNRFFGNVANMEQICSKLAEKVQLSDEHKLTFSEFGTRRRFSFNVQDAVISYLNENAHYCAGTSNCYFAMKYNMKPLGTHPHEWFMFHGAQFGYKHANYMALENWVNVYDGDLGIALSDTYTSGIFLSNISRKQAKLFDGVRCDSGDEFLFTDRLIARYRELGIDPTTKTIIFSNALDFGKALDIQEHCRGKIRCSFGIGTNLTNDTGFKPSNIVMKLTQCKMNVNQEWRECVKLSDDAGKHIGSEAEVRACLYDLRLGQQIEPLC